MPLKWGFQLQRLSRDLFVVEVVILLPSFALMVAEFLEHLYFSAAVLTLLFKMSE
jgi:hypothetical protein